MPSLAASWPPIAPSASLSTRLLESFPQTASAPDQTIYAEFSTPPIHYPPAAGALDIDTLVAQIESESPANTQALQQGRQWVAARFYADRPSLARLRLQKGWSQAQLAQRSGASQSYIARLEQGKIDPQISTARKIATALEVSVETLNQALTRGSTT